MWIVQTLNRDNIKANEKGFEVVIYPLLLWISFENRFNRNLLKETSHSFVGCFVCIICILNFACTSI